MNVYKLKDYEQALILACKGHFRSYKYETTVESIYVIVARIIGCNIDDINDNTISYWLYRLYEKLMDIDETNFKRRNAVRDFMTNRYDFFRNVEDISFDLRVVKFLISEMNTLQVYKKDRFRIELNEGREYLGLELKGE